MAAPPPIDHDDPTAFLHMPVGKNGSGAARYAAAMQCYNNGLICAEMLEIYRRCSKFDLEDPIDLARYEEITVPAVCLPNQQEPTS
ncbi:hypothetical protein H9Q16_19535 [Sulfitobacter sp. TSTF-M16]|uniref:Uncharacterized protein n=2 Tax=Sulfitobacter aestuariivivens TaxID=2766981 RepID=A0A927D6M7_9RHOB|nr:hypothetical protein [Sulfitobacter aestuariivivens]